MRAHNALLGLALPVAITAAHPGGLKNHAHRHVHEKRKPVPSTGQAVDVPGPAVVLFEFQGQQISEKDVCLGISNGTLNWAPGTVDAPNCAAYGITIPAATASATPINDNAMVAPHHASIGQTTAEAQVVAKTTQAPVASEASSQPSGQASAIDSVDFAGLTGYNLQIASNSNVTKPFPDGQLSCNTFPSTYGAIPVNWVNNGGWTAVQHATISGGHVTYITTSNTCTPPTDGTTTLCSYACPPSYQKAQWPSTQGPPGNAQTVGGLMCGSDGKLHLTNSGSKYLCMQGTNNVFVQNKMSAGSSVCRTDYPGTESETVPLHIRGGTTSPLTCPDSSNYFQWLGQPTSAQYYVNMKNVPVNQACQWSTAGSSVGNWAPVNFGTSTDEYGKTWMSIMSTDGNAPGVYRNLDYNVQIVGDISSPCFYTNGKWCTGGTLSNPTGCQTIADKGGNAGCTTQLMSGNGTYVLTD